MSAAGFLGNLLFGASAKGKGGTAEAGRPTEGPDQMGIQHSTAERPKQHLPSLFSDTSARERERMTAWLDTRLNRARKEIFSETVEITPVLAELLLKRNPSNRTVKETVVERYATDIRDGHWVLNGEPIILSQEGLLNDGQHRLSAIIRAGRGIKSLIVFGVRRSARLTTDQGAARTAADYLTMDGIGYANQIAAIAQMIWQINKYGTLHSHSSKRPTKAQIMETASDYMSEIVASIGAVPAKGSAIAGSRSLLVLCHWLLSKRDADAASRFVKALISGADLPAGHPILYLRDRLRNDRRMTPAERLELIVRAWKLWRGNKRNVTRIPLSNTIPLD